MKKNDLLAVAIRGRNDSADFHWPKPFVRSRSHVSSEFFDRFWKSPFLDMEQDDRVPNPLNIVREFLDPLAGTVLFP